MSALPSRSIAMASLRGISSRPQRPRALVVVAPTSSSTQHRAYHVSSKPQSPLQQQQQYNYRRIISSAHPLIPTALRQSAALISQQQQNHQMNCIPKRWHGGPHVDHDHADSIHVSFVDANGTHIKADVDAYVGESLLQVAQRNDIELEGACEGVCACSTCHVIVPDEDAFDSLEEASEDEEDMLDMAFGLTETSRLGCQIIITDEMDGMKIEIPQATRNFYVDGHVPQPH